jgi:acetoin utilization protein AcuB
METQGMTVETIMTKNIVTVALDDSLKTVKEIFDQAHFHHLLVVESERLLGVLSDRDLLKALSPNIGTLIETHRDTATLNKKVHQIMTRRPISLAPHAEIYEAIAIFNTHKISCIPVVDDEQRPVGIITWRDILKALDVKRAREPHNTAHQGRS